jgi:hypothetical protein
VSKENILDAKGKGVAKASSIFDSMKKSIEADSKPWLCNDSLEMNEWLLAASDFTSKR